MSTALRLTREERSKVHDGTLKVVRRKIRPIPLAQGKRYVVAFTRRVRQIVDRDTGAVIGVPAKPHSGSP